MGNCMETYSIMRQQEEVKMKERHGEEGKGKMMSGFVVNGGDDDKGKNNGARVKVVLTKEELKWLILQLSASEKGGGMKLEQVLQEIERGREEKVVEGSSWKPSLESILEAPEMLEIER